MDTKRIARLSVLPFAVAALGAEAKGPTFADVIASLDVPSVVRAGEALEISARVDVPGFCARTQLFESEYCEQLSASALSYPWLELAREEEDTGTARYRTRAMVGYLSRGADGVFRGTVGVLQCQQDGRYAIRTMEPNPTVEAVRVEVRGGRSCEDDLKPPWVVELAASAAVRAPGLARVRLVAGDDSSGAAEAFVHVSRPVGLEPRSYTVRLGCHPCGSSWECDGAFEAPLSGTYTVYFTDLVDHAGNVRYGSSTAPLQATVVSGDVDEQPLAASACELPGSVAPPPASGVFAADPSAPAQEEPPRDYVPPRVGCASTSGLPGLMSLLLAGLTVRRRTRS
ncbi:MAG: hypothetical protein HYZ28_22445 [Myxococcales bacterium]|nr:hypothetical protein [Myxococcales bacterium]